MAITTKIYTGLYTHTETQYSIEKFITGSCGASNGGSYWTVSDRSGNYLETFGTKKEAVEFCNNVVFEREKKEAKEEVYASNIDKNIDKLEKIYSNGEDVIPAEALILIAEKISRLQDSKKKLN